MSIPRPPNDRLRALLAEAGWTGQALAQAVNALGAETGLRLRYDRTSVAHWLAGMCPRPPVPALVAEAFERRLGRPMTVAATGLVAEGPVPPDDAGVRTEGWEGDAVTQLADLGGPGRRRLLEHCVFTLGALSVPAWAEATLARPRTPGGGPARVGTSEVAAATLMTKVFSAADAAFGGGHARAALAAYLATDIAPWLRADAAARVRHELFTVAARLTYLCGFMCFDDELHGAAQRYYRIALRLAAEAGDSVGYAIILRALSVQAHTLGHHGPALQLAESALEAAPPASAPLIRAFLHGQAAVAAAGAGDRHGALSHLRTAENYLEKACDAPGTVGAYHPASLAHQRAEVCAALGDRPGAIGALALSVRHRPPTERRSRVVTLARLADLQLDHGHVEQAAGTWNAFLDEYPSVDCGRARTALATLRSRLRPYQHNPAAGAVLRRVPLDLSRRAVPDPAQTR